MVTPLNSDEVEAVWEFVRSGGTLLVLEDHTKAGGEGAPANLLLSRAPLKLRFDSALPARVDWLDCYSPQFVPCTSRLEPLLAGNSDLIWGIGASLETAIGMKPLLVSRYGFSDIGNLAADDSAYLGNYRYDVGEILGDMILAGVVEWGDGKVIVMGDTSSFQNRPLASTFESFVGPLFKWAAGRHDYNHLPIALAALIVLGYVGAGVIVRNWDYQRYEGLSARLVMSALAAILLLNLMVSAQISRAGDVLRPLSTRRTAVIDTSLNELISLEDHEYEKGISGLALTLTRLGYCPIIGDQAFNEMSEGSCVFIVAPTKRATLKQERDLVRYVEYGGHVVIATDYVHSFAVSNILDDVGLSVGNTPLGPVPLPLSQIPEEGITARFVDAWPVTASDPRSVEVLYRANSGHNIVVRKHLGKGSLTVVGDSRFFLDNNIESLESAVRVNMEFIRTILDKDCTTRSEH